MLVWYNPEGKIVGTGKEYPTCEHQVSFLELTPEQIERFKHNFLDLYKYRVVHDPFNGPTLRENLLIVDEPFGRLIPAEQPNSVLLISFIDNVLSFEIPLREKLVLTAKEIEMDLIFFVVRKGNPNDLVSTIRFKVKEIPLSIRLDSADELEIYSKMFLNYSYREK